MEVGPLKSTRFLLQALAHRKDLLQDLNGVESGEGRWLCPKDRE